MFLLPIFVFPLFVILNASSVSKILNSDIDLLAPRAAATSLLGPVSQLNVANTPDGYNQL